MRALSTRCLLTTFLRRPLASQKSELFMLAFPADELPRILFDTSRLAAHEGRSRPVA